MRTLITVLLCLAIVACGALATKLIFDSEPVAERSETVRQTAMLVQVTSAEFGTFRPQIRALGAVEAARSVALSARVSGRVTELSDALVPGGLVNAGDVLVSLDREDSRNAVAQRNAELAQARADLRIEEGRGDVARFDLELVGSELPAGDRDLVLRAPQRDAAEARVAAARAALRQAEATLGRTRVTAPFDAHVVACSTEVGAQVAPGEPLAQLVGTEAYWVIATVPQATLRWLEFNDVGAVENALAGSRVSVRSEGAWPDGAERLGVLRRPIGALEENTRLARVVVEVPDPLARTDAMAGQPALLLGGFVDVSFEAREIPAAIRLPRALVRTGDTVWEMADGVLRIREVEVAYEDAEFAYITAGLEAGALVVTTQLSRVREGAELRVAEDSPVPTPDSREATP